MAETNKWSCERCPVGTDNWDNCCFCCFDQVKRFLESSWQAPDFVERYCDIYLRLRTAMEELFGQQMSFMLALCHGFSGGLLQLSFLTAMHVSKGWCGARAKGFGIF